jgi:hypothetical protein
MRGDKQMRHIEHEHQKTLFIWWTLEAGRRGINPRLMWATPNGGFRHMAEARRLKAEGVKAGVPDVFLAIPSQGFHGLFLELKAPKGRVSPEQSDMLDLLRSRGYVGRVCYGWDQAREAIEGYLGKFIPKINYLTEDKKEFVNLP